MKFNEYFIKSNSDKFSYFMDTRFSTNRLPTYWVNWENVLNNIKPYEVSLNTLNYLVGKKDIKNEAKMLFTEQPDLLKAIPILLASRDMDIDVLVHNGNGDRIQMSTYKIDFKNPNAKGLDKYLDFMEETGLLKFLENNLNKSLVDYVYGVQAGLDSNGRKNRGGTQNEIILGMTLSALVKKNKELEYKEQATGDWIFKNWNIVVPETIEKDAKGGRRYDGAVYNPEKDTVTIIETNFYNGGGSKLKAVAGEFSSLYETSLRAARKVNFVWISDGPGWSSAKNPMREAFDVIPAIINLKMVEDGMLEDIVLGDAVSI